MLKKPPQYQWVKNSEQPLVPWEETGTDKGSTRIAKRKVKKQEKGGTKMHKFCDQCCMERVGKQPLV